MNRIVVVLMVQLLEKLVSRLYINLSVRICILKGIILNKH